MNWTPEELKAAMRNNPALAKLNPRVMEEIEREKPVKKHKFNAKPEWFEGHYWKSQEEKKRYCELKILKAAGVIKDFKIEPNYDLDNGISYKPDFEVEYWDHTECEEVKGKWTAEAKIKLKMFRAKYPDKKLIIIRNGVVENVKSIER